MRIEPTGLLLLVLVALVARGAEAPGQCVIRVGGKALAPETHAIVIPAKPTPQEEHAAKDLADHIERLTGRRLAVVPEQELGERTPIAVGKCLEVHQRLGVKIDLEALGAEGIRLLTKGPALILAGNKRGVLYAVYTFLEDYCNCRWFTPHCTVLPKKGTFEVENLDVTYIPPLEYRSTDYPCSRDADWAVRNKINGTQTRLDEPRGGKVAYYKFVHTFNSILNPASEFAKHPDYFSMVKGKRVGGRTQLCLTNPAVVEIAKRVVRRWIREAPWATIYSVSQNDWGNYCQCPNCSALAAKEGSQAGPLIHFVNAIARDIARDYPDKIISTLAYQWSRTPPRSVRPEPNVCVRLCTIECDFAHPLETSTHPQNRKFVEDIRGWNRLCNRLYIWDYIIDYRHSVMPWPNLYVLKPNIQFFIRNGVKGLYEEACYFTKGSEFAELRTWIIAKTMWNPDYDTDKAIDEFLAGYYGPAAPFIRRYINLIHKPVLDDPNLYIHIWTGPDAPYLSEENIRAAVELFDQAEKAVAKDPVVLHRVQVARLPIMYVQIARSERLYREAPDALVEMRPEAVDVLIDKFEKVARREGLTMIREHRASGDLDAWLRSVRGPGKKIPIVRLESPKLKLAILPTVGGRIWRLVHKPSGHDILKRYRTKNDGEVPTEGGYEEYSQTAYRSPGWNEPYRITARTENSIALEANLKSGLRLTRKITLDPKAARLAIETTITNPTKQPRTACIRVHPSYDVPDLKRAFVRIKRKDGSWEARSLAADAEREAEDWLEGDDLPAGEWQLDTGTGLLVVSRFKESQVSRCLLSRDGKEGRVNLELYSRQARLAPGQRLELTHEIEVTEAAKGK